MIRPAYLVRLGVFGSLALTGCASASSDEASEVAAAGTSSEEQELSASTLRARAHIQLTVREEGSSQLTYEPSGYPANTIPYEGLELGFTPEGSIEVDVAGDFPSTARVLVVDDAYRVIASGRTELQTGIHTQTDEPQQLLGVARLRVPRAGGKSGLKVLVRDARWDRTMNFRVDVRR